MDTASLHQLISNSNCKTKHMRRFNIFFYKWFFFKTLLPVNPIYVYINKFYLICNTFTFAKNVYERYQQVCECMCKKELIRIWSWDLIKVIIYIGIWIGAYVGINRLNKKIYLKKRGSIRDGVLLCSFSSEIPIFNNPFFRHKSLCSTLF